jgi:hypothetical protein
VPIRNSSWYSSVERPHSAAAGRLTLRGAIALLLVLLAWPLAATTSPAGEPLAFEGIEKVADPGFLRQAAASMDTVEVMVLLEGYRSYIGRARADDAEGMRTVQAEIAAEQERVLASLDPALFEPGVRFENLLGFAGRATLDGVAALAAHPDVASIEEDEPLEHHLEQGLELINAVAYRFRYNGTGVAVGIIDSGIDYGHVALGGPGFPNDKVIGGRDFGDNDADPLDCHSHGTNVAGIVAGLPSAMVGDYIGGVATGAKLYALKVGRGCNGGSTASNLVASWDWAVTHQFDDPDNPILVLNASLGSANTFGSACDSNYPTSSAAAANLAAAGITLFASSGNSGMCDGIAHPACLSDVVSVGAVFDAPIGGSQSCVNRFSCVAEPVGGCSTGYACFDEVTSADQVTCYSNSAGILDLLAPSNDTYTTDLSGSYDADFGGTSAASPYAAGAAAVLQSYAIEQQGMPYTPAELLSRMKSTGSPVLDERNGLTKPRVNLSAAFVELEICDDLQDNDGDTLTDCADPDCISDFDVDTIPDGPCGPDCDPSSDQVWAAPPTITGVRWVDGAIMEWDDVLALTGPDTVYQVIRGRVSELPVGAGPNESCMGTSLPQNWLRERSNPPEGEAFFYLIRARNSCTGHAIGYGEDSSGADRATNLCP